MASRRASTSRCRSFCIGIELVAGHNLRRNRRLVWQRVDAPRLPFMLTLRDGGLPREEFLDMCDYSLHSVRSRPAKVGEKLVTHNFGTGTRGFAAPENCSVAVCVLPGTELAFEAPVKYQTTFILRANTGHTVAIFRQINKGVLHTNHDALEFPDGEIVLLTRLYEGQNATVLTLPTQPKTAAEAEAQQRVAYVG